MKVSLDAFSPPPPPPPRRGGGGGGGGGGLRWEIFFSIIDSKHSSKALLYDSPPLPLTFDQPNLFYEWPLLSLNIPEMSILERDAFTVLIYLVPIDKHSGNRGRILWFPCIVQYTSMLFFSAAGGGGEKPFLQSYDYNPNVCLTMLFSAKMLYKDQGRSAFFTLHHLAIDIKGYELHELICKQEQHALVCASEILWRDEQTKKYCKSPLLYLNRAHDIRSSNGKDRLYIWRMAASAAGEEFHGMKRKSERDWHKQMQEHEDMVELGLVAPFSVKRSAAPANPHAPQGRGGLPDHEAHSKLDHAISPILVVPGQTVVLKFFNLFDPEDPRRSCEVHIKWNDYVAANAPANAPIGAFADPKVANAPRGAFAKSSFKRFSLNALSQRAKSTKQPPVFRSSFIVYSGFTVEIDYVRTMQTISIIAIYAHVQNYHFTINKLGHYHLLNSA